MKVNQKVCGKMRRGKEGHPTRRTDAEMSADTFLICFSVKRKSFMKTVQCFPKSSHCHITFSDLVMSCTNCIIT